MGYLLVAHVTESKPNMTALRSLPSSIGWAIHHRAGDSAHYVDAFRAGRPPRWPFTSMPPTRDLSLELTGELNPLSIVYGVLEEAKLENSFKRGFLNLNLAISKVLQLRVCSFCSDDDGIDFSVVSDRGQLLRLHCQCGDLDIVFEDGRVTIQPFVTEEDDEATDVTGVENPASNIFVLKRNVEKNPVLHRVAAEEVAKFIGADRPPLGFGGSDEEPPPQIESSEPKLGAPATASKPEKKPWWKLW